MTSFEDEEREGEKKKNELVISLRLMSHKIPRMVLNTMRFVVSGANKRNRVICSRPGLIPRLTFINFCVIK